jgi:hypothetical protein
MSARKSRTAPRATTPEPEITAQPKPIVEDFNEPNDEVGVSIDPDQLGVWALRSAVQEGYVPPSRTSALSLGNGPATDDAESGPNFDEDHGVWEHTIDVSLQAGGVDRTREEPWVEPDEEDPLVQTLARDVDLTQNAIREASLFDAGAEETADETRDPEVNADNDSPEHLVEERASATHSDVAPRARASGQKQERSPRTGTPATGASNTRSR